MPRSPSVLLWPALIAGGLLAGCSQPHPHTEPTTAASSAAPTPVDDASGAIACGKAISAVRAATLMDPGVITDIATAADTADAPIADAAQRLSKAYTKAVAAHDKDTEPDAIAAVSAAGAELVTICGDSGLETTG